MKITVLAVGKAKDKRMAGLVSDYAGRLRGTVEIEWNELAAESGKVDPPTAKKREGERIISRLPKGAEVAALSENGKATDSRGFAAWVGDALDRGRDLCFLIGGPEGLHRSVLDRADRVISLGRLTMPHELVRVVLAEQIYRAFTILRGEPYHRD